MSYCSRSCRRRFTVLGFKFEHLVAFAATVSNICTAHAQRRLFMYFRCKFRHRRSIRRTRFPVRVQNVGDLRRFPSIVAFNMWMSAIFLLPVCLTYWRKKYTTRVHPLVDNNHQVWSWYVHTLPSYSVFVCWHVTWLCVLDFWPFDLEQLLCMAGHVPNLATKFKDRTPISSWFMSHNVSRWLPVRMRTRPLRMRRITWPVSRGSKTITFLESPTLICLFSIHLRWLYDECN